MTAAASSSVASLVSMSRTPAHVRQAQQSVARAVARALVDRVAAWRTCCSRRPSRELLGSAIGGGDSAFADAAPPARLWSLLLALDARTAAAIAAAMRARSKGRRPLAAQQGAREKNFTRVLAQHWSQIRSPIPPLGCVFSFFLSLVPNPAKVGTCLSSTQP